MTPILTLVPLVRACAVRLLVCARLLLQAPSKLAELRSIVSHGGGGPTAYVVTRSDDPHPTRSMLVSALKSLKRRYLLSLSPTVFL